MAKTGSRRFVILLVAALLALISSVFYKANPVTNSAQRYASTIATTSAAVYITLRSLNAILSAAQEVEVGGSLVASVSAQPFKVLEPIDDTIERVAGFVFFVMVATGVLAVAMGPVGAIGFAMAAFALCLAAFAGPNRSATALARRLGWYGVFLGFALPLAFVCASLLADRMTEDVWLHNTAVIEEITAQVSIAAADETGGWFQNIQSALSEVDRYQDLVKNIYSRADDLIASFIAILAVFVFKVLVMPAMILGGFFVIARFFASQRADA